MTTPRFQQYGLKGKSSLPTRGFTLFESMATILILSIMLYAAVGSLDSLRSTSRLTAAQNLVSALEEARSEAMRYSSSSLIMFRKKPDDFGKEAYREYGLLQRRSGNVNIVWRQLPKGVVLWEGTPSVIQAGTNALTVTALTPTQHGITGLQPGVADQEEISIVFGDLGEVVFPAAQPVSTGAGPIPGPYYLCVAEENQTLGKTEPTNMQLIEIRASTGRAQLLP